MVRRSSSHLLLPFWMLKNAKMIQYHSVWYINILNDTVSFLILKNVIQNDRVSFWMIPYHCEWYSIILNDTVSFRMIPYHFSIFQHFYLKDSVFSKICNFENPVFHPAVLIPEAFSLHSNVSHNPLMLATAPDVSLSPWY